MRQIKNKTEKLLRLGRNIKVLRTLSGMTGVAFASTIGTCRTNLYYLETGGSKNIAIDTIYKLCDKFNITPNELFNETIVLSTEKAKNE